MADLRGHKVFLRRDWQGLGGNLVDQGGYLVDWGGYYVGLKVLMVQDAVGWTREIF